MPGDALEVLRPGLEDAAEGLELLQGLPGRGLAVPPGRAQGQEQLDDLVVQEGGQAPVEELLAQAVPVPLPLGMSPVRPAARVRSWRPL